MTKGLARDPPRMVAEQAAGDLGPLLLKISEHVTKLLSPPGEKTSSKGRCAYREYHIKMLFLVMNSCF